MASLFDEPILRAPLCAMTEDGGNCVRIYGRGCRREQYVNGFIDLVAVPYGRNRQLVGDNNKNLDTAVISLADAITYACSKQMTQQENLDFHAYIRRLEQYHA